MKTRHLALPVAAVSALVLTACGGGDDPTTRAPAPTATVTVTATPGAQLPPPAEPTPPPPAEPPAEPPAAASATTVKGDGEYLVGKDMPPGGWLSTGPQPAGAVGCVYEILVDGDTVAFDLTEGQARVTLADGQLFKSTGCNDWRLDVIGDL